MNRPTDLPFAAACAALRGASAAFVLSASVSAQLGQPVAGPFPLGPGTTGSLSHSGAAWMDGSLWVGGNATMPGGGAWIHELDRFAVYRSSTPTCPLPSDLASPPRDFAWIDSTTSAADCLYSVKQDKLCCYEKGPNGLVCILETTLPVPMDSLAVDSLTGLHYGALGTSPITVFTVDSNTGAVQVVNTLPPSGKLVRGLAWNPVTNTLWAACANNPQGGPLNLVQFNELSAQTGALTGQSFMGVTNLPAPNVLAGCEIYHDFRNPGKLSIVAVHRSAPDALMIYDLGTPFACTGYPRTYCTGKTNSLGCVPVIDSNGTPQAGAPSGFTLRGTNVLNNKAGLLFYSMVGRAAQPYQGGIKCVASPFRRGPTLATGGTALPANDCSGVLSFDMNAFAAGLAGGNPDAALSIPGMTVRCQWWSRDPAAPPSNSSLSNALEYDVCP